MWLCLVSLATACTSSAETTPDPSILDVRVSPGRITTPDSVRGGWKRLHVVEEGGGHIVVLFRLTSDSLQLNEFIAAIDTSRATPVGAVAFGGPEIGSEGEIGLDVVPGRYLLACMTRDDTGHRHATRGEVRMLVVTAGDEALARADAGLHLRMTDFAYVGLDTVAAGPQEWMVTNAGRQDHQLRLAKLDDGVDLRRWLGADDPSNLHTDVAGVARMGPARSAWLSLALEPGTYVMYCLVPDAGSTRTHVELGMFRGVVVR